MATLGARLVGSLLLVVAASRMAVAERVVASVKDETLAGGVPSGVAAKIAQFGGSDAQHKEAEEKRLAEEAEEARIAQEAKEAEEARIVEEARQKAEEEAALEEKRLAEEAEEARIAAAEKDALVEYEKLLPGTWITKTGSSEYTQRWYRIGETDQVSYPLPIKVMKGERAEASSVAIGDTVEYTAKTATHDNQSGDRGVVVKVMPQDAEVKVQWEGGNGTKMTSSVKISSVSVIEFESKAFGNIHEGNCTKHRAEGQCCETTLEYHRKEGGKTRAKHFVKSVFSKALKSAESDEEKVKEEVELMVRICLDTDSPGKLKITETRAKVGAGKLSTNFFVENPTSFKKKDD